MLLPTQPQTPLQLLRNPINFPRTLPANQNALAHFVLGESSRHHPSAFDEMLELDGSVSLGLVHDRCFVRHLHDWDFGVGVLVVNRYKEDQYPSEDL